MAIATIQFRRGPYADFVSDKPKMREAEPSAVLRDDPSVPSGKAFYVCFGAGDVRRMVSVEDLEAMLARGDFNGEQGVGIADVKVNAQSHVIVTLTDGSLIDAGYMLDVLEQINADEQKRIQAEKARESAEAERRTVEALRESAESARDAAERTRKTDETARKSAEAVRAENEAKRTADEAERTLAEQARMANESVRNTAWFSEIKPAAELAVMNANQAADNASAVADDIAARAEAGEFDGGKGDKGDKGDSGVMAPSSGMFSLWLDQETGDLFAEYPDGSTPPQFEYDAETGNLYFVTDDGEG